MIKDRPTSVFVIAILHLVFGFMGLLLYLCAGGGLALLYGLASASPNPNPNNPAGNPFAMLKELPVAFYNNIPGVVPYFIVTLGIGFIFNIVIIVAGFGLLKMKKWARTASILYGVVTIVLVLGSAVYQLTIYNPGALKATQEWTKMMEQKLGPNAGGRRPPPQPAFTGMASSIATTVFGTMIGLIYPIAVLWVMYLPGVVAAFQRAGESKPLEQEEDELYERRHEDYDY